MATDVGVQHYDLSNETMLLTPVVANSSVCIWDAFNSVESVAPSGSMTRFFGDAVVFASQNPHVKAQ